MPVPDGLSFLLRRLSPLAIAFSGGLDSRFLSHAASLTSGVSFKLYHIKGPHMPGAESAAAISWARERGFELDVLVLNPLEVPEVGANGKERCYYCKRHLFTALGQRVDAEGSTARRTLCDGSNQSDLGMYRPGLRALRELGIRSPLAETGLDKASLRDLARETGMDRPDQAARPCLLTRFAYGLEPSVEALTALAAAEQAVEEALLAFAGGTCPDFRLRLVAKGQGGGLPYMPELHVAADLSEALGEELIRRVTACGFATPRLVCAEAVSGHYDRTQPAK